MEQGIQTFLAEIGEAACYALDIIQIGMEETGRSFDPVTALLMGIERQDIYYNAKDPGDNMNFYVTDPASFLSRLTGMRWSVEKADPDYTEQAGERIVERWERIQTGKVIGHFRLPHWDSILDSKTVRYGNLISKRVFRRVA